MNQSRNEGGPYYDDGGLSMAIRDGTERKPRDGIVMPRDGTGRSRDGTNCPRDGTNRPRDWTERPRDGTDLARDGTYRSRDGTERARNGPGRPRDGNRKARDGTDSRRTTIHIASPPDANRHSRTGIFGFYGRHGRGTPCRERKTAGEYLMEKAIK